jgi:hypothetical protein
MRKTINILLRNKSVHVLMLENYNYAQSYEIKELFGRVECK